MYIIQKKEAKVYFQRGFLEAANVESCQFELVLFETEAFGVRIRVLLQGGTGHPLASRGSRQPAGLLFVFDPPLSLVNVTRQL